MTNLIKFLFMALVVVHLKSGDVLKFPDADYYIINLDKVIGEVQIFKKNSGFAPAYTVNFDSVLYVEKI